MMRIILCLTIILPWKINEVQAVENFHLRSAGGKCLAIKGKSLIIEDKSLNLWSCNHSNNQNWHFDAQQRLVNIAGKCLTASGHDLTTRSCDGTKEQRWQLDNKDRLVNGNGKCLDIPDGDLRKKGGEVQLAACNNSMNQRWFKDPL